MAMLGQEATNDRSESALGRATHQLQRFGRSGILNAATISDAKSNGCFTCFTKKNQSKGMFHQFDKELRESLLITAIEDSPETISINRDEIDKQREAKEERRKYLRLRV
jgi:hypothetical protein